jgi:hypothetical protein
VILGTFAISDDGAKVALARSAEVVRGAEQVLGVQPSLDPLS